MYLIIYTHHTPLRGSYEHDCPRIYMKGLTQYDVAITSDRQKRKNMTIVQNILDKNIWYEMWNIRLKYIWYIK